MSIYREYDTGNCSHLNQTKKWNDSCKDFKLNQNTRGKPYMNCENCINWKGKGHLEQSRL